MFGWSWDSDGRERSLVVDVSQQNWPPWCCGLQKTAPPLLQVAAREESPSGGPPQPRGARAVSSPQFCLDVFINSDLITLRCAGIVRPSTYVLVSSWIIQVCSCFSSRAMYRRDESGFQTHSWYVQVQYYRRRFLVVSLELPPAFCAESDSVCPPCPWCWLWKGFKVDSVVPLHFLGFLMIKSYLPKSMLLKREPA